MQENAEIQIFKKSLKDLWDNCYPDLYDECRNHESDLEVEINKFIEQFFKSEGKPVTNKYIAIAKALCLAVKPLLESSLTKKELVEVSVVYRIIKQNKSLSLLNKFDEVNSPNPIGIVAEAMFVLNDFICLVKGEDADKALFDMIDGCVIGSAICHGADDKRRVFHWFLYDVLQEVFLGRDIQKIYPDSSLPKPCQ